MPPTVFVRLFGLVIGVSFFLWVAGPAVVSPVNVDWTMKFDWRIHFLGWHIFRGEPWSWPPGLLSGYYHAPNGTSIGYTDSIPLVALPLKAFSPWLPMPMQYLGIWLLASFALQGYFGALIAHLWTRDYLATLAAAALFVLMPILLHRAEHPALCTQWVLLWAIWLYLQWRPDQPLPTAQILVLTGIVSLVHPYLAVMTTALLAALLVRRLVERRDGNLASTGAVAIAMAGVLLAGWWTSGLFIVTGSSMTRIGMALYSMNLLGPVMPQGWSALLPEIPSGSAGQAFEGFQYFGAGILAVVIAGIALRLIGGHLPVGRIWPLVLVSAVMTAYALSPRVTVADRVLLDWTLPMLDRRGVFAAVGRFFWPAASVTLTLAVAAILCRCSRRVAAVVLSVGVILQIADLRPAIAGRRALARSATFHVWPAAPRSPVWAAALPHYRHIVLYYPAQCGGAPVTFEMPGYLAGLYGLTMNVGQVARASEAEQQAYCVELERMLAAGQVRDDSIYLVHPAFEAAFKAAAPSLVCGEVDGLRVCATAASYEPWRDAVRFE
jgi:hypothetical protein